VLPDFRAAVLAAMEARGWTQYRLAKVADVPQPTVSRYLAGAEIKSPQLEKLAGALGLELLPRK